MSTLKIGVRLESLGLPLRRALQETQRLGVAGVQVDAAGDLAPDRLSQTGRRELRHLLRTYNVELAALNCPLRRGLDAAENQEGRIDHVKKVMSLSFDLGPRLVLVQAGGIPGDDKDPRASLLAEALLALGQHGDRVGAALALTTGLEEAAVLRQFLERLDAGSLGVNFDPASLLVGGFNPYEAARAVAGRVLYAKATDARHGGPGRAGQEVALGQGELDWMMLLSVLAEIEYRGWLTVAREGGDRPAADVAAGVALLRRLVS